MIDLKSLELPLSCPKCKFTNKVATTKFLQEATIQCENCGCKMKLKNKDGKAKDVVAEVQQSLDDIENAIRKIGANISIEESSKSS